MVALLLAFSFTVHVLFALLTGPPNFWEHYTGTKYIEFAENIVGGRGYPEPLRTVPLYGLALSGLLWIFARASLPVLLLHAGFGLTTTYLTYRIGRALFSPLVGLLAGLLISVHPYLVKLTMQIIDTGPSVAMTSVAMWLMVRAWLDESCKPARYALAGVGFALAALVRPVAAVAALALAAGAFVRHGLEGRSRRAVAAAAALLLAWAAVMSPWWIRNYLAYGRFIPLTAHGGLNFHKGHTMYYDRVHPTYDTDHFRYTDPVETVNDDPSGALRSAARKRAGVKYIREHPLKALATDLRKIVWLYGWHKVPRSLINSDPYWDPELHRVIETGNPRPAPQDIIYSAYWVPVLLLFLLGLLLSRQRWQRLIPIYLVILANAATVAMAFADTRYRLEVEPCIVVLSAHGAVRALGVFGLRLAGHGKAIGRQLDVGQLN
jgi:hypothetical protein